LPLGRSRTATCDESGDEDESVGSGHDAGL
jgi:hypothetical protein